MKNGILLRVGVDSTKSSGGWNAPCAKDGRFCYVPIRDYNHSPQGKMFDHTYDEFCPFVSTLGQKWPETLTGACHLDPDFTHLTYGDQGSRANRIGEFLSTGDFIAFWAALRLVDGPHAGELVCSLIGLYTISSIVKASDIGVLDCHRNAHTRYRDERDSSLVVFADPRKSGRLRRHIEIGKYRNGAQRVSRELLQTWGNLKKQNGELWDDGYLQLSGSPPIFSKPEKFLKWFDQKRPQLVHANNV